ncbi:MarR family winged helix-turn-helix transcriptional regulator [Streptomyces sp. ML-6]|uniref:MarR family winged helix-turn-helix transcriptional regulator n=1 Tax=Streptomyces sp. ML-6 TaxID=2982693 RepID=UPI0024BF4CD6|nr:MarR family winged helix-turn-helix transcriptional regulator [Streptomyces sp. ML-6]MDK0523875.1 MarR family winged helix-turn-helix transcriptional regulator [Streptomyces sp. ML-6]
MATNALTPSEKGAAAPGDLVRNLGIILRGFQTRFETAMDGMPAGVRGYHILSTVVHGDPPNQQAIGAHLGIDRTVLTYLIDTLVDAGLVERVPDPVDRRARKIVVTASGAETLARYGERVAAAEADLLSALSPQEATTLTALTGRLSMHIHRAHPGVNPCEAMDHL